MAGLEAMADFVKRMGAERTVAVISVPGDRSDGDMQAFGDLSGKTFSQIVIREDDNTRGRKSGSIADILSMAAVAGGMDPANITMRLDELEAVRTSVDMAGKTDLVVLMVDKPVQVWEMLTSVGASAV